MPKSIEHKLNDYRLRARLPQMVRYAAVFVLCVTVLAIVVGFYRERSRSVFKLKSEHTQLSTDVVAEVNGYERLETDGDLPKYYIKADYAKTFSDNHQELEGAYIRTYDQMGNPADTLTAQHVLYVPEPEKNFTAYLNGAVDILSRDGLHVTTTNVTYSKKNDTAEADEAVEFERETVRGKSFGAVVKLAEKRIDLLKNVEISTFESPELAKSDARSVKMNSDSAFYDQGENKVGLNGNVAINIGSKSKSTGGQVITDIHSGSATGFLIRDQGGASGDAVTQKARLRRFELVDDVHIVSTDGGNEPTKIDSGYAIYDKELDRFELKNGAHIVTVASGKPTDIRASNAVYDQAGLKLNLNGSAEITQGTDLVKGENIDADLFPDKKIKDAVVKGDAFVRQTTEARTTSVSAPELNIHYNDLRQLKTANTIGESTAELTPNGDAEYSQVTLRAPRAIHVTFKNEGLLEKMLTEGRTTIQLNANDGKENAANKRVTADAVNTYFFDNGKDLRRAEAIGNAELFVDPVHPAAESYRTTINAPRFDCEFFPTGNNAKSCVAGRKTKTVRDPVTPTEKRGVQTLFADQLTADFNEQTKDVQRLDALGNSKFVELDRSAVSNELAFTPGDGTVRLRGGEPTVWDDSSRARAREIDWDTRNKHSFLRGKVSTTYYSRRKMGDAVPFTSSDRPVFITSDNAEMDHTAQVGTYTGNVRGWQDSNYVRSDRLTIRQNDGTFSADGKVQSVLYDTKEKNKAKAGVPVFAASDKLNYSRDSRLLQYRENVDIRQGTDRITSASTDVYLSETNEMSKTIAEGNVVITQPGRRATGKWVQYTSVDQVAILRGSPASVNDAENGASQAAEITFNMRENRVLSQGVPKSNGTGRTRSVYKVKPTP